jgi:hypothetical protein
MKKNVASQSIGAQMVSASDGSAFTGAVTVYVTGDNGTQAAGSVGSGACTHEGNGYHSYAPAQAETNYDHIAFTFIGTGAIPATVQVFTTFPQTGDSFARIGANGAGLTDLATAAAVADLPTNAELSTALAAADDAVLTAIGDLPTNAELATALASADDAVLAAIDALPTAAENADAVWDEQVDGTTTARESMRLQNSAAAGKVSGAATTEVTIRDLADTKDRIVATVDGDGNRTAITRDVS